MNEQRRLKIAVHEAGHAVINYLCGGMDILKAQLHGDIFGQVLFPSAYDDITKLICLMAGPLAAEEGELRCWAILLSDLYNAKGRRRQIIIVPTPAETAADLESNYQQAVEGKIKTDSQQEEILIANLFPESGRALYNCYLRVCARRLINEHWQTILAVAGKLFYDAEITQAELAEIVGSR